MSMSLLDKQVSTANLIKTIEKLEERLAVLERTAATGNLEETMGKNQGYINGAWQKDPIRLGYSGQRLSNIINASLGTGTNNIDGSTVPSGEIWVITNISMRYTGTVSSVYLRACIYDGSNPYVIFGAESLTSGIYYDRQGLWILEPGDNMRIIAYNATAGDVCSSYVVGYRVDIDQ